MRILGLIPARGGSKGIKNKNIIDLCGKPLIAYTIEAGLKSKYINDVVVTTDSEKIADVSKKFGAKVPFLRPKELATDKSKTIDAVINAITELEQIGQKYDILVLLQPTQPLRDYQDIDNAIEEFINNKRESLVSVCEVSESPILMRNISLNGELENLLNVSSTIRRQDMPKYYKVNGAIYINYISDITNKLSFNDNKYPYIMEKSHSVDIDEEIDLEIAKYYINCGDKNEFRI